MYYLYDDAKYHNYLPLCIYREVFLNLFSKNNLKVEVISECNNIKTLKNIYILINASYIYLFLKGQYNKIECIFNNPNIKVIVINSEPFIGKFKLLHHFIIKNAYYVFEYSVPSLLLYKQNNFNNIDYIPIAYSEVFENFITNKKNYEDKEYDIFFYGIFLGRRLEIINKIKKELPNIKILHKKSITDLNNLFYYANNSKLCILNHSKETIQNFNYYRASFLISTHNIVLHETITKNEYDFLPNNLKNNLLFSNKDNYITEVKRLINLSNNDLREIEQKQYNFYKIHMNTNSFFINSNFFKNL